MIFKNKPIFRNERIYRKEEKLYVDYSDSQELWRLPEKATFMYRHPEKKKKQNDQSKRLSINLGTVDNLSFSNSTLYGDIDVPGIIQAEDGTMKSTGEFKSIEQWIIDNDLEFFSAGLRQEDWRYDGQSYCPASEIFLDHVALTQNPRVENVGLNFSEKQVSELTEMEELRKFKEQEKRKLIVKVAAKSPFSEKTLQDWNFSALSTYDLVVPAEKKVSEEIIKEKSELVEKLAGLSKIEKEKLEEWNFSALSEYKKLFLTKTPKTKQKSTDCGFTIKETRDGYSVELK